MNNFKKQDEIGKIGEAFVIDNGIVTSSKFYPYYYDVRTKPVFQMNDIDFVLSKYPINMDDVNEQVNFVWNKLKNHHGDIYDKYDEIAIEVKTDTEIKGRINKDGTIGTNNVCLELISHDKAGCVGETRSDIILYICLNENKKPLPEYYSINVFKMRNYIREHCREVNKRDRFYLHNTSKYYPDNSMCLICNAEELEKNNIIKQMRVKDGTL